MALTAGTRLGSYEITATLGAGGMGEVYRAVDTKLGREVAIKTLPSDLASDPERLARFEREAKLLAALNHANIAAIYGLDEHNGMQFLVMELVEGETLEQKLEGGALPLEDALHLAVQMAEALEAAHEKGVVHRDLKPANIMITRDDVVKILDFGLAKAVAGDPNKAVPAHSPTLSLAMTQQGLILGTAGYMSPEQASGQATDQRADIWAFGVVLYEMLTGLPLFRGESVPHILAAILQSEPDWSRLPKRLHPRLHQLLERCLEKKLRDRYHSIADARVDLEKVLSDPTPAISTPERPRSRPILSLVAGSIIGALVVGSLVWSFWSERSPAPVKRFVHAVTEGVTDDSAGRGRSLMTLAPDGQSFVYSAADRLYVRPMNGLEARPIPGTEEKPLDPFFSPDSQSVAYFADGTLKKIALSGGPPVPIARNVTAPLGASWNSDGTILYGQPQGIFRVSAEGGTPQLVIRAEQGERLYGPELLPDGDSVLFSATTGTWDEGQIVAQSLSTKKRTVLVRAGSDARYVATGHLVYALDDGLFGVAFDAETLKVSGSSVPLEEGVMRSTADITGTANYGIAADGTLSFVGANSGSDRRVTAVWVDRDGNEEPTGLEGPAGQSCSNPSLSPDGTGLAYDCLTADAQVADIWRWSFADHTKTRLTPEPGFYAGAVWSPDSSRIAYLSRGEGLLVRPADGAGMSEKLLEGNVITPWDWPDGDALIFGEVDDTGNADIGLLRLTGDHGRRALLATKYGKSRVDLSPNGRWLAYQSNESGQWEIYVRPFPDVDARRWTVSSGGGEEPRWSADSRTLFFVGPESLMETAVGTESSTFTHDAPKTVFDLEPYWLPDTIRRYDVSPSGQRFLLFRESNTAVGRESRSIIVVTNWVDELQRRVPTP